jgi:hypothetical protein
MDDNKRLPAANVTTATSAEAGPTDPTTQKTLGGKLKQMRVMLVSAVIGGVIGYAGIEYGTQLLPSSMLAKPSLVELAAIVFMLPLAFFFTIVVHELGHLFGALANGFRFRVLTMGPWSIILTEVGVRHRFSRSVLAMLGGQQISAPPVNGATDRQYIAYLLGGGVANIVTGVAALALIHGVQMPQVLVFFLLFFALCSLLLGPVNLFPFTTTAGISTDGYHIRSLRRGGAAADVFRATFQLIADMYGGVRPREWKPEMVKVLSTSAGTQYEQMVGHMVAMSYAQDRGEFDKMIEPVGKLIAGYDTVPAGIRSQFAVELAYYFAIYRHDAANARRYANDLSPDAYLISVSALHRGWAAAYYAEGDYNNAEVEVLEGLALIDEATTELDRLMERELLLDLRGRIAAAREMKFTAPSDTLSVTSGQVANSLN